MRPDDFKRKDQGTREFAFQIKDFVNDSLHNRGYWGAHWSLGYGATGE